MRTTQIALKLTITTQTGGQFVDYLHRTLRRAVALLNPPLLDLSIALVNDGTMSHLHQQFLGGDGPTDVLTFGLEHDSRGRITSGEVIVCVPEARRQARRRGHPAQREVLLYALHGLLHLSGFDDRTASGFRAMHRMEDDILTRLGIGPVFAAPPHKRGKIAAKGK